MPCLGLISYGHLNLILYGCVTSVNDLLVICIFPLFWKNTTKLMCYACWLQTCRMMLLNKLGIHTPSPFVCNVVLQTCISTEWGGSSFKNVLEWYKTDVWWVQLFEKYNNHAYCVSGLKDKMKCLKSMLRTDGCGVVTCMHLCILVLDTSLGLVVEIQWSGYDGFLK